MADRTVTRRASSVRRLGRKLGVASAVLVVFTGCKPLDDAMVALAGRSMRDSRSFDPYENTRPAPAQSVAFSSGNYPSQVGEVNVGQPEVGPFVPTMTIADVAPPGSALVQGLENPVPTDAESLARGEVMYNRVCAACHATTGMSADAPLAAVHPVLQAYNLANGASVDYSDGYIYAIIRMGRGAMPAYGHQVTHFDRWHIVNYLRTLQTGAGATPTAAAGDGTTGGEG